MLDQIPLLLTAAGGLNVFEVHSKVDTMKFITFEWFVYEDLGEISCSGAI